MLVFQIIFLPEKSMSSGPGQPSPPYMGDIFRMDLLSLL